MRKSISTKAKTILVKRLSIIVPVYNVKPYVGQCLQSILDKSGADPDDFEVIIINDGSPDDSMLVVRDICSKHKNVIILEQDNQGLSAARMNGLLLSRGEYVWFVDSDDWIEENGVISAIELTLKDPSTQVFLLPLLWEFDNPASSFSDIKTNTKDFLPGKRIIQENLYPISAAQRFIIKKALLQSEWIYFPAGLLHEDEYFGMALLYKAEKVCVVPGVWYHYRQRSGSIMSTRSSRSAFDTVLIYQNLLDFQNSCVSASDKGWFHQRCYDLLEYSYIQLAISNDFEAYHVFKEQYLPLILSEHRIARSHLPIKTQFIERLMLHYPRLAAHIRPHLVGN